MLTGETPRNFKETKLITLTYAEALSIQEKQLAHYSAMLTPEQAQILRHKIASETEPCLEPNVPKAVRYINAMVPRGTDIEDVYLELRGFTPAEIRAHQASMD